MYGRLFILHGYEYISRIKTTDVLMTCSQTAIVTFVDNVTTLGIENCLLDPLQRIFTSQVVNYMEDSQVRQIATEPSYISEERDHLNWELENLQAGLRTFNFFKSQRSSLGSPPVFGMLRSSSQNKSNINRNLPAVKPPVMAPMNGPGHFHKLSNSKPGTSSSLFGRKCTRFR